MRQACLAAVLFVLVADGVAGHHSFAVYFDETKSIAVSGSVTAFKFTNPHAIIELSGQGPNGQIATWRGETNAVTLLRRRGWTAESLRAGDVITIEGWPARDGSNYMRVRRVLRADGTVLGAPPNQRAD